MKKKKKKTEEKWKQERKENAWGWQRKHKRKETIEKQKIEEDCLPTAAKYAKFGWSKGCVTLSIYFDSSAFNFICFDI